MCAFGCCLSAWMATLGPRYGLRTMALSRFTGGIPVRSRLPLERATTPLTICRGYQGTFIFSLLNILTQLSCESAHGVDSSTSAIAPLALLTRQYHLQTRSPPLSPAHKHFAPSITTCH